VGDTVGVLREGAPGELDAAVPIAGVYPLEQAAAAHAREERGHILGRIVLRNRKAKPVVPYP
jgi:hypothetical protein